MTDQNTASSFITVLEEQLHKIEHRISELQDKTEALEPATPGNEYASDKDFLQKLIRQILTVVPSVAEAYEKSSEDDTKQKDIIEKILSQTEEIAALSGHFNPSNLVSSKVDETTRQAVLNILAADCTVETVNDEALWFLTQSKRTSILRRLIEHQDFQEQKLSQYLSPTDLFGKMLRELLKHNKKINLKNRSNEELLALISAIEATSELGIEQPDVEVVRQHIKTEDFLTNYEILLSNGFFGRRKELQALNDFLELPQLKFNSSQRWEGLILTGIGGAGKSTLLAKFAKKVRKDKTVVVLDFDRPGINPSDTYWLTAEISRQVGYQYPQWRERLRETRNSVRQERNELISLYSRSTSESSSEDETWIHTITISISEAIKAQADGKPILLILDTFEEAANQDSEEKVLEWLSKISELLVYNTGLSSKLKVIFSGRLYEDDQLFSRITNNIKVDQLEPAVAQRFLQKHNVTQEMARRLTSSKFLPRRPLELKLLAKLIKEEPTSIEEIEDEIRKGGPRVREMFAGIVYRRVLRRIDDEKVRLFAYPGLVLRYVTPRLIREILVPALNLLPLDEDAATDILNRLAAYSWLVKREPNGEVWHRRDLREMMLKLMISESAKAASEISSESGEPDKIRSIHKKAIEVFSSSKIESEWAESIYHRLMLVRKPEDAEDFELQDLKRASQYIRLATVDLPPPAAAVLQFAINGQVPVSDVKYLPKTYLSKAYDKTGRRLVNNREFGKAMELLQRGRESGLAFNSQSKGIGGSWEIDALFCTAEWDELRNHLTYLLKDTYFTPSLQDAAKIIHPAEIVEPELVDINSVQSLLSRIDIEGMSEKELSKPEIKTTIGNLAFCLVLLNGRRRVTNEVRAVLKRLVQKILKYEQPSFGAPFERKVLALSLLGSQKPQSRIHFSPSTFKLDLDWLSELKDQTADNYEMHSLITEAEQSLQKSLSRNRMTVRNLLGEFDGLYKNRNKWKRAAFQTNVGTINEQFILKYLRGPDLDFRDPVRFALLEAYPDYASWKRLGEIIADVVNLKLEDLEPDSFAESMSSGAEHSLENYVELVDRRWSLGKLLHSVHRDRPKARKISLIGQAYERWNKAFHLTVMNR